jgi:ABC-type oligopeptide transport system substrate-binding subunit
MHKRFLLSVAMLAIGAAMLAASSFAAPQSSSSPQARRGGIMKFSLFAGIENIDPQRSYYVPEWQYEWLTARMLLNFAHATGGRGYRLLNDGAASYTVSKNGKVYTFRIRSGMKLSNGAKITSANYRRALLRVLHPEVGSPLASFLTDPAAVNIVGALAYNSGQSSTVSGIRTVGPNRLRISLVQANPLLPTLLALPPTGAIARDLPFRPITSVNAGNPLPAGGRYYVQEYVPDRSIKIRKNPNYRAAGAAPTPGMVDGFDYDIGVQQDQALLLVKNGSLDWAADGLPPSAWGPLFSDSATKGRTRVYSTSVVDYVTMNNSKGVFQNLNARKAVAWGIARKSLVDIRGPRAGFPQCSLLTPAIPGYKACTAFPKVTPNLSRARTLARPFTGQRINYWYTSSTTGTQIQQLATAQLRAIGFNNIEHRPFSSGLFTALGRRGNDYDFALVGWAADFPDPYDYVNKLLSGETIQDVQNNNTAYFNNPTANRLMRNAARLKGQKRLTTYGNLDNTIQSRWTPIAPINNRNDREFFSTRVDMKTVVNSPIYQIDLGKIALK